jgi:hypothetical protein
LIRILGTNWIEQNLSLLINHILEIAGNPQVLKDSFSRKCITFILRSVTNLHLNDNAQFLAAKELTTIIMRCITNDSNVSSLNSSMNSIIRSYRSTINPFESIDTEYRQNILICALYELNSLIRSLGASTSLLLEESCNDLIETLFSVILNSSQPVRLIASWCFRSISIVKPSLLTPLIDQCLEKMNDLAKQFTSSSTDSMSGLASVLQALLGAVHRCPLGKSVLYVVDKYFCLSNVGIPSEHVRKVFDFANNLLRTMIASTVGQEQSFIPRQILQRTSISWHCLSACCTLDQSQLKRFIPRLVLLWRSVFPRSPADFEREKKRGDSLTWILSFNQRSSALCSMISFFNNHSIAEENLISTDLFKRMVNPITNAITILFYTPNLIRQFEYQLEISIRIFRLRLYELLLIAPIQFYEQHFTSLLTTLTTEFTLVGSSSNTTTSLLKSICHDVLGKKNGKRLS